MRSIGQNQENESSKQLTNREISLNNGHCLGVTVELKMSSKPD
jgi:hypothetical protein